MHTIILAGGFGTRLRSVVSDVPKPLAPIAGEPFLARLIALLARKGASSITLSVHHEWEKIRDYFIRHPAGVPIDYAVEKTPLGTGGGMAFALKHYTGKAPVLVLNGDSYTRVDYKMLYERHLAGNAPLTMVLRHVPDTARYGAVAVEQGIITSFGTDKTGNAGLINAGVYVMQPRLFEQEPLPDAFSFELDFIPPRVGALKPHAFMADDYFIDIGIPADYERACRELPDIMAV